MSPLPSEAQVVIIGGGIVGCSTAYHLAKLGYTDTVLVEKHKLTSGSTFHAAGLVGQLRTSANVTQLLGESVALYRRIEAETGQATGWKMNGGLRLACNGERWTEVRRQATTAHSFGLEMHLLSPAEAQAMWPLMEVDDVVGAAFLPTDGQANPSDITMALAKGARAQGVTIAEDTEVLAIEVDDAGTIRSIKTTQGAINCQKVVLCAGQWTRALAASVGVSVPLVSVEHQYVITEPIGVPRDLPTLRDPDRLTYYKEEVGGLVMGGYEPNPKPWAVRGMPVPFQFQLLEPDFDHFAPIMELACGRVPTLRDVGINQLINGPESFTPDGNFILGEAPELAGLFVGAGFNAFGIAAGGGAGMALAEWVATGAPPFDLWVVDIRRFGKHHRDTAWVRTRTLEAYAKHYTMAWPHEEHHSGRPCRTSPLYARLRDAGACFGEKLGWERPNWFASADHDETPHDSYTYGRQNWFQAVGREHRATRTSAALFDQTSFAKYVIEGQDAGRVLDWICANDIRKPVGALTYTQMLDDRGGIQCDLTVCRTEPNSYYLVTGTGFATHDAHWIAQSMGVFGATSSKLDVQLRDVTSGYACLALMGPNARLVLSEVCDADLSNEAHPFGAMRKLSIAGAPVMALRVTYVGELGWELHFPAEFATGVYDALMRVGASHGLVNGGYRAIESCRLEKGYRAWGADIGPDHTPLDAGLAWAVKLKTDIEFRGRVAIERQRDLGLKKMLATFTVDPRKVGRDVILLGRETIYRNGVRVGWLSSGGYGYSIERSIGMGYVRAADLDAAYVLEGDYELEVATERVPVDVTLKPLWDPTGARVRA